MSQGKGSVPSLADFMGVGSQMRSLVRLRGSREQAIGNRHAIKHGGLKITERCVLKYERHPMTFLPYGSIIIFLRIDLGNLKIFKTYHILHQVITWLDSG
jgi:hypothetical protein